MSRPIAVRDSLFVKSFPHSISSLSQIMCEAADIDHHEANFSGDAPLLSSEFLLDSVLVAADLCSDLSLGLHEDEPDSWTHHVGREISKKLDEKEVKRQEHIYEFILTEKSHCVTLLIMQKVFVDGLKRHFHMGQNLDRMFPRLLDLTELHLNFLSRLRKRQRENPIVSSIADILVEQFSNIYANKLKSAYGEFCSRHRDALEVYKYYFQNDSRFKEFMKHCQTNPLLKKKGIPECILFVTQRLTKYPLLIQPLIKTNHKDNVKEKLLLEKALESVKDILVDVDSQVAEKEKESRKLEIYSKIDGKSYTIYRGLRFDKSHLLANRALRFEGLATLNYSKNKSQVVTVVVLSDVLLFLQENSHKYSFFSSDNKSGVLSLQKLLVRENARDSKSLFLISSYPECMYVLEVQKPNDKDVWCEAIRKAIKNCPEDDEDKYSNQKQLLKARQKEIKEIMSLLKAKDLEQATLLEEKIILHLRLLSSAGLEPPSAPTFRHIFSDNLNMDKMWKEVLQAVQQTTQLTNIVYNTSPKQTRRFSSAGEQRSKNIKYPVKRRRAKTFGGFDLSFRRPIQFMNKKFCNSYDKIMGNLENSEIVRRHSSKGPENIFPKVEISRTVSMYNYKPSNKSVSPVFTKKFLTGSKQEQQYAVFKISQNIYTLFCIISHLVTSNKELQAQAASVKGCEKYYKHNQQLEELRNLQDRFTAEKAEWNAKRDQESKELEEKRKELLKLQEQIKSDQTDIDQQREQLFRKMEQLSNQGVIISSNMTFVNPQVEESSKETSEESSPLSDSSSSNSSKQNHGTERRDSRRDSKRVKAPTKNNLPINLISTSNQYKVSQNIIKQQLPLKLASTLGSSNLSSSGSPHNNFANQKQVLPLKLSQEDNVRRISASGYQRLGSENLSPYSEDEPVPAHVHMRAGSSPVLMQSSSSSSQSLSNTGQALTSENMSTLSSQMRFPEKFRVSKNKVDNKNSEEEVIYL